MGYSRKVFVSTKFEHQFLQINPNLAIDVLIHKVEAEAETFDDDLNGKPLSNVWNLY